MIYLRSVYFFRRPWYAKEVGGTSPALREPLTTAAPRWADPKAANENLKLLWIACGKGDRLIGAARKLSEALSDKGVKHTRGQREGAHSWPVWRKHRAECALRIFTNAE